MDYYPIIIMLPFLGLIVKKHAFFRIDTSLSGRSPAGYFHDRGIPGRSRRFSSGKHKEYYLIRDDLFLHVLSGFD